ncbi:TrkA C-terminal domain-containing protein [Halonotius roseus]|uniref:Potassium transporter TrkA n=1 Tax=Halonotius roseus TaxID=2511997 RepID=A0A544QLS1_9EURY|nr:TrkA C-terminal domain-containing protein [Halonotius roseus]TQQ79503.1 potassium transporter TrkA [Halonotius roseus]
MTALPFDILLGIYLGVLTGIIPALVSGVLGFLFKYVTDVSIPGLGVVVLALAIAGINGGLLALNDPTIRSSENAASILTAIIVVLMLALYAHAQGDKLGAAAPKRLTIKSLRDRTLNTDVIELVGGRNQVRLTVLGEPSDIEGYPPLPADLRQEIADGEWTFPADLPIAELETRFADRLQSEFDLADVTVDLDEAARARVAAAPPMGSTSRRVPAGKRAVSLSALVPTGIARGESVRIVTPETNVTGTVIAARSGTPPGGTTAAAATPAGDDDTLATDGGEEPPAPLPAAATTTGGEGRITVAVSRSEATTLLSATDPQVVVCSRGTRREFELVSLLRRSGVQFKKVTVAAGGPLDGHTIGEVGVRDSYNILILAAKHEKWQVAPRGEQPLSAGDQLYVIGTSESLDRFAEAAT